ncbi:hypothetical protein TNCT_403801 [Trichonephila clavata]|uniref:Uncharacterized protein n=2 Tax=Trichonephila clavata TaxID=2740835 RepID=A0A8X6JJ34_TRICU|nr:hypothetical protein TNCT_370671 [Trichonephila clavata]GFR08526.1 hypothetical protein TNCT_304591 [Trichonephila clavata]GFR08534.1 hypothetical protein TNCT_304621 [Trichonephila clavata]GFR20724.1 hypothetical protein TNCT_403801 [Trichonephila clavata]
MNGTVAGMAPKRLPRDIKSGHCDPKKWACFSIRTFSNERPWAVSLFRKGIHCVLKCLRRSIDSYTDARREVSRTALSYGSLCCSSKSLKYSWTVLNHCFVVWMDAFSAQRRYPAVHGQVGGIVLLSKETCTVGKPIPLCPGDLKHCIVILKRSSVVQRHIKNTALLNNEWDRGRDGSEKVAP